MKVSIMQPYLMPYIGYLQLMEASDKFVVYDDVAYINKGWINRNRVLFNNEVTLFTLPLKNASQNKLINEIEIDWQSNWANKFIKSIIQNYKKSNNYKSGLEVIDAIFKKETDQLSKFILDSLLSLKSYLNLKSEIIESSTIFLNSHLKAQDRIIDIAKKMSADTYINAIGGKQLYQNELFLDQHIELKFLEHFPMTYNQSVKEFVPYLSVIDLIMNLSPEEIKIHLAAYKLID